MYTYAYKVSIHTVHVFHAQMHSIMYVRRTCSLELLGSRSVALARSLASAGDANLYK